MVAVAAPAPNRVRAFMRLVMIEHSIFALPFAYVAALAAMRLDGGQVQWGTLALITLAMVAARTVAMAANRIIDRRIDAQNPRTAKRELITGAVSLRTAWVGLLLSLVVFEVTAAALNPLCLVLSPVALFLLVIYSYAKRFTNYPQFFLAAAQAVAPVGAWVGVTGEWSWPAFVLGVAVGTWIGGFDCIYAVQDLEADRRIGIGSVPVKHGVRGALIISAVTHVVTVAFYVWFGAAGRPGLAVDRRGRDHHRRAGLRARHREAQRPVPSEPSLLHRQRRDRHRPVRLRPARPGRPPRPARLVGPAAHPVLDHGGQGIAG